MRWAITILTGLFLLGCGGKEPPATAPAPRPVTVIDLKISDPVEPLLLTGSVKAWKVQDVAFEVEGTVSFVAEESTNLDGRWVENGEVRIAGDLLATLDKRTYKIARAEAAAQVEVAEKDVEVARVERAKVLPAQLKAAEAQSVRADELYKRDKKAYESNAISRADLIRATADRDARIANVEEAKAAMEAKDASIIALQARLHQTQERLRLADYDLDRCELFAPFSGEISEVFIEAGGFAQRGQDVARLVMMNPIKVDLAISPRMVKKVRRGDAVNLYIDGVEGPVLGRVYDKATTADPETRTFRISILTTNKRQRTVFPEGDPREALPKIRDYMFLILAALEPHDGTFFVEERRALRKDDRGWYLWASTDWRQSDSFPGGTEITLRKFRVKPGDLRYSFQGLYLIRSLDDIGELEPGAFIPLDVPDSDADEQKAVIIRSQWLLRPGQLVPVLLRGAPPAPGLYLPMDAIQPAGEGRGVIFLAENGKARRVEVRISDNVGSYFRVEGEGVAEGVQVITDYIHFLKDGEPVSVIRRRETR